MWDASNLSQYHCVNLGFIPKQTPHWWPNYLLFFVIMEGINSGEELVWHVCKL